MKSDSAIHKRCIAAIVKNTYKPYDYKWTKFYESNEDFFSNYAMQLDLSENELIICSTIIDGSKHSLLTTKRLCTNEDGDIKWADITTASDKFYGDFKGYDKSEWTFGKIVLANGQEFKYYIETGKASMIMIHGVRTRIRLNQ